MSEGLLLMGRKDRQRRICDKLAAVQITVARNAIVPWIA
jgi:hypothetical protein